MAIMASKSTQDAQRQLRHGVSSLSLEDCDNGKLCWALIERDEGPLSFKLQDSLESLALIVLGFMHWDYAVCGFVSAMTNAIHSSVGRYSNIIKWSYVAESLKTAKKSS